MAYWLNIVCVKQRSRKIIQFFSTCRIGFAIAKRLAIDGAKVVVSSRKEANVKSAVDELQKLGLKDTLGTVCHVGKAEDRSKLLSKVRLPYREPYLLPMESGMS